MRMLTTAKYAPTSAISAITIKILDLDSKIPPACEDACAYTDIACANISNYPQYNQNPRNMF